jgi:hypothetical protein
MDVYLVPVGRDLYECYYEAADKEEEEEEMPQPVVEARGFFSRLRARVFGFFGRMRARFNAQLKEAEEHRHQKAIDEPRTFLGRMHKRSMRWIAERIAEQRLLWHLRTAETATLHTSSDLPSQEADSIMRASMKRDADFHRNRLVPHTLALILAGVVAFVPGPNVLGYLFTFTVVGHFLAWRGAVNALHKVAWTIAPNPALTDLRRAFSLGAGERHRVIKDVAHRLHLPRMALFVERMANTA